MSDLWYCNHTNIATVKVYIEKMLTRNKNNEIKKGVASCKKRLHMQK